MSYDSLLLIKRKWMGNIVFIKSIHPSFSHKGRPHTSHQASLQWSLPPLGFPICRGLKPQRREDVNAFRCSESLSSKDGKQCALYQLVLDGITGGRLFTINKLQLTVYSLLLTLNY